MVGWSWLIDIRLMFCLTDSSTMTYFRLLSNLLKFCAWCKWSEISRFIFITNFSSWIVLYTWGCSSDIQKIGSDLCIPVDTQRRSNVYKTSISHRRRLIYVETTSSVYWDCVKMCLLIIFSLISYNAFQ